MADTEKNTEKTAAKTRTAPVAAPAPDGPPAQAARGHSGGWKTDFVKQLIGKPGEWFVLNEVSPSVVSHLKKIELADVVAGTKGELEVSSRNSRFVEGRKTRVAEVYARYVAPGK